MSPVHVRLHPENTGYNPPNTPYQNCSCSPAVRNFPENIHRGNIQDLLERTSLQVQRTPACSEVLHHVFTLGPRIAKRKKMY